MELYEPFSRAKISQLFGQNANTLYSGQGLKGHTSIDYDVPCGTPVVNLAKDAFCYSVMNKDNSNLDKYRAVFTLVEDNEFAYEVSYGHADTILAVPGKTYKVGQVLMTSGNTGDVYTNGVKVTQETRRKGGCPGGHLHGPQVRKCKLVSRKSPKKHYLTDANGILKYKGKYVEVVDYENGYNGCEDPMLYYNGKLAETKKESGPSPIVKEPLFKRDLTIGMRGDDVRTLQKYLNSQGVKVSWIGAGSPGKETDYFGPATQRALATFQRVHGISPAIGYLGSITRAFIGK